MSSSNNYYRRRYCSRCGQVLSSESKNSQRAVLPKAIYEDQITRDAVSKFIKDNQESGNAGKYIKLCDEIPIEIAYWLIENDYRISGNMIKIPKPEPPKHADANTSEFIVLDRLINELMLPKSNI